MTGLLAFVHHITGAMSLGGFFQHLHVSFDDGSVFGANVEERQKPTHAGQKGSTAFELSIVCDVRASGNFA